MPSVIHVLGLAFFAAITVGTVAVYYALNGGDQFLHEGNLRRRSRSRNVLRRPMQPGDNQVDVQNERDNDNPCGICNRNIQNAEYDLTVLSCNHNFHCRCICDHFRRTATNENMQSTCPVCRVPYSIADIN